MTPIPAAIRWLVLLWLAVWIPAYWKTYGPANFVHLCDVAVILSCIGLWRNNALLLSSQAVSSIVIDSLWTLDVLWRLLFSKHLIGGTEYLWDPQWPLWVRLLSLFHTALPFLLLWALGHVGYDRRGLLLQSAIAVAALVAARFTWPAVNINYAFRDPILHRSWGPAPVHVALMLLGLILIVYLPTNWALAKFFPPPALRVATS
jgi:hypothetical protein